MREVRTIVVGGGPAGSTCARELVKHGADCLILERQALPKFKLCAGWLSPPVLRDLEFFPRDYPHGLLPINEIRLYAGRSPLRVSFPTSQYSIRRVEFDNWLLARCGAPVLRHAVRSIVYRDGFYEIDGEFRCRSLVGAGGSSCPVKRSFFGQEGGRLIVTQEVEFETRDSDGIFAVFYPFAGLASYAWRVPKAGALNIGFGGVASQFDGNVRSHWPDFVRTLRRRGLLASEPPAPKSHPYYVGDRAKAVREGNAYLVGDAAGLATADLGEGISPAVHSGLLAARDILGLEEYSLKKVPRLSMGSLAGRLMAAFVASARE